MSANDPLPSWNDGPTKSALVDFVARVTDRGGPDYVRPTDRIATFDNDGTLWSEQPVPAELFFAFDRMAEVVASHPAMRERQPYKALLERDLKTIHALGKKGAFELAFATHAGMSEDAFVRMAKAWFATATHPKLGRLFQFCTYWPQRELLDYLGANGFKSFIVSGGGIDLIRAFSEDAYGIPTERVIGSSVKTRVKLNGGVEIMKLARLNSFDDRNTKVQNIGLHVGRRPILAFGNSDGDLAMLRYAKSGPGARLALLLHHDDAEREFAYDRDYQISPLAKALDKASTYGISVVSMKQDWATIFDPKPNGANGS